MKLKLNYFFILAWLLISGCGVQTPKAEVGQVSTKDKVVTIRACSASEFPFPLGLAPGEVGIPITNPTQLPDGIYSLVRRDIYISSRDSGGVGQLKLSEVLEATNLRRTVECRTPFKKETDLAISIPILTYFMRGINANPAREFFRHSSWNFGVNNGIDSLIIDESSVQTDGYFADFMVNQFDGGWSFYIVRNDPALYEIRAHKKILDIGRETKIQMRLQFFQR